MSFWTRLRASFASRFTATAPMTAARPVAPAQDGGSNRFTGKVALAGLVLAGVSMIATAVSAVASSVAAAAALDAVEQAERERTAAALAECVRSATATETAYIDVIANWQYSEPDDYGRIVRDRDAELAVLNSALNVSASCLASDIIPAGSAPASLFSDAYRDLYWSLISYRYGGEPLDEFTLNDCAARAILVMSETTSQLRVHAQAIRDGVTINPGWKPTIPRCAEVVAQDGSRG